VPMSEKEIRAKLMRPIGKPVVFNYPDCTLRGVLLDRVISAGGSVTEADYWDVVDLIEFPNEPTKQWVRLTYYRQAKGRLRFAGQWSISEPLPVMKNLLRVASEFISSVERKGA